MILKELFTEGIDFLRGNSWFDYPPELLKQSFYDPGRSTDPMDFQGRFQTDVHTGNLSGKTEKCKNELSKN